jgi:CHAT domain-containing protein
MTFRDVREWCDEKDIKNCGVVRSPEKAYPHPYYWAGFVLTGPQD